MGLKCLEDVVNGRVLVVIMNKDNADGLKDTLYSLVRQLGSCTVCKCFDVLVIDGGSKDNSEEVVAEFSSRYPCIKFKVQELKGGVGPARIEAVKYALDNGYEFIIWGDSENVYSDSYINELLSSIGGCDVVSGKPLVACSDICSKLFFWYHAYHVMFKYVRRTHAPGNNKLVKVSTYSKSTYLPIVRSDDFYFSVIALRKGVKYCYSRKAIVTVKLPSDWEGIKSWQRARMHGSVQGAKLLGLKLPPDFIPWFLLAIYPLYIITSLLLTLTPTTYSVGITLLLTLLAIPTYLMVKLYMLSKEVCIHKSLTTPLLGLIGMYLHSLFTTYYAVKFSIKYLRKEVKEELMRYFKYVDNKYGLTSIIGGG